MNTTKKEDVFQELLSLDPLTQEGRRSILETIANESMILDREHHIGVDRYKHSDERNGQANGFKDRALKTDLGTIHLKVPQVRGSQTPYYPTLLFNKQRSTEALYLAAAEAYINGVSTRKVALIFKSMLGYDLSAAQVSRATKRLDDEVEKWRNRPLGQIPIIYLDATYHKARVDNVVRSVATFIAIGVMEDGRRIILGVDADISEHEVHWKSFLEKLLNRGMWGVKLIVSDQHTGLRKAIDSVLPGAAWQRCQMHLQQNAQAYITKASLKAEVANDIRTIFASGDLDEARYMLEKVTCKYEEKQPRLAIWMAENLPDGFTVFSFPQRMQKRIRTNNTTENLNGQIKSRTNKIGAFPSLQSLVRLVSLICIEISETWESDRPYLVAEDLLWAIEEHCVSGRMHEV